MSIVDKTVGRFGATPMPDFGALFNRGHKDGVLDDMVSSVRGLLGAANARRAHAQAWFDVGKALRAIIVSQNAEFERTAQEIERQFEQVARLELKLADAQTRNAEDFRDIIERYDVLFKVNEAWLEWRERQKEASLELDAASRAVESAQNKPDLDPRKREKLEQDVTKARAKKGHVLGKVKECLQKLVETRIAYTRLKVRRLKHGWGLYGRMLKEVAEEESAVLLEVKRLASQLQGMEAVVAAVVPPAAVMAEPVRAPAPEEGFGLGAAFEGESPVAVQADGGQGRWEGDGGAEPWRAPAPAVSAADDPYASLFGDTGSASTGGDGPLFADT